MVKDVAFEPVEGSTNSLIDDACRAKYKNSSYLAPMIGGKARVATIKIVPRSLFLELAVCTMRLCSFVRASAQDKDLVVRIAKLQIDSAQMDNYKATLLPVTVFEVYANSAAYEVHLKTAHFKKYKSGTQGMVKSLELIDVTPIALEAKSKQ